MNSKVADINVKRRDRDRGAAGAPPTNRKDRIEIKDAMAVTRFAMVKEIAIPNSFGVILLGRLGAAETAQTAGGLAEFVENDLQYPITNAALRYGLRTLSDAGFIMKHEGKVSNGKPGPNLSTYTITDHGIGLFYKIKEILELAASAASAVAEAKTKAARSEAASKQLAAN